MVRDAGLGVLFGVVVVAGAGVYFFFGGKDDADLVALESFSPPPTPAIERRPSDNPPVALPNVAEPPTHSVSMERQSNDTPPPSVPDQNETPLTIPPDNPTADASHSPAPTTQPIRPAAQPVATDTPTAGTDAALPLVHIVDKNESLAAIAQRYYRNASRVDWIVAANPEIKGGKAVRAGTKLVIPRPPGTTSTPLTASAPPREPPRTAAPAPSTAPATYKVKAGDNLTTIAGRVLGDRRRWQEIFDLNKAVIGKHPEDLRIGMVLKMPAATASRPVKAATAPHKPTDTRKKPRR